MNAMEMMFGMFAKTLGVTPEQMKQSFMIIMNAAQNGAASLERIERDIAEMREQIARLQASRDLPNEPEIPQLTNGKVLS